MEALVATSGLRNGLAVGVLFRQNVFEAGMEEDRLFFRRPPSRPLPLPFGAEGRETFLPGLAFQGRPASGFFLNRADGFEVGEVVRGGSLAAAESLDLLRAGQMG